MDDYFLNLWWLANKRCFSHGIFLFTFMLVNCTMRYRFSHICLSVYNILVWTPNFYFFSCSSFFSFILVSNCPDLAHAGYFKVALYLLMCIGYSLSTFFLIENVLSSYAFPTLVLESGISRSSVFCFLLFVFYWKWYLEIRI